MTELTKLTNPRLQSSWQQLQALREKLPHALLLHGQIGVGKSTLAMKFSQSILCQSEVGNDPCGECRACHLFALGHHPGMFHLNDDIIKIDQVRELNNALQGTVTIGNAKVVLVDLLENLNRHAANALLKLLEEPPSQTYFILVSDDITQLPATIFSRCVKFPIRINMKFEQNDNYQMVRDDFMNLLGSPKELLAISSRWQTLQPLVLIDYLQRILHVMLLQYTQSVNDNITEKPSIACLNQWYDELCETKQHLKLSSSLNHQYCIDALVTKFHFRGVL